MEVFPSDANVSTRQNLKSFWVWFSRGKYLFSLRFLEDGIRRQMLMAREFIGEIFSRGEEKVEISDEMINMAFKVDLEENFLVPIGHMTMTFARIFENAAEEGYFEDLEMAVNATKRVIESEKTWQSLEKYKFFQDFMMETRYVPLAVIPQFSGKTLFVGAVYRVAGEREQRINGRLTRCVDSMTFERLENEASETMSEMFYAVKRKTLEDAVVAIRKRIPREAGPPLSLVIEAERKRANEFYWWRIKRLNLPIETWVKIGNALDKEGKPKFRIKVSGNMSYEEFAMAAENYAMNKKKNKIK